MPELPEVENVKRSIKPKLTNRTIKILDIHDARIVKYNDPQNFIDRLEGTTITNIFRRGKFLVLKCHNNETGQKENFIVHLGMTGALLHNPTTDYSKYPSSISNHILMEAFLDDGTVLIYSDYRRFGSLRTVTTQELESAPYSHLKTFRELGPEPFQENALNQFIANIRHKRYQFKPIKDVLLDQRVIAGVGNIYANECLFPNGIHPKTDVWDLSDHELERIFNTLVQILELSISLGGSSIKDYVDGDGKTGTFQDHLKVYNQHTCPTCEHSIIKTEINKRATYHCPSCQPSVYDIL